RRRALQLRARLACRGPAGHLSHRCAAQHGLPRLEFYPGRQLLPRRSRSQGAQPEGHRDEQEGRGDPQTRLARRGHRHAGGGRAETGALVRKETAMPIGITFDETMAGAFTLGQTEPAAGAAAARRSGDLLAMHATVTIPDLDAFIADPKHLGQLKGSIDFTPFGSGIVATSGVFNLFSPSAKS